jgi:hypothetical protein
MMYTSCRLSNPVFVAVMFNHVLFIMTAVAFRDDQLLLIFESANNILQELLTNAMSLDNGT